ncbi:MAG: hypothetical protein MRY83_01880, partial [Flavobacteriales bacterium]|nr:hypothetical protein [Flavobacteriales bacterium]
MPFDQKNTKRLSVLSFLKQKQRQVLLAYLTFLLFAILPFTSIAQTGDDIPCYQGCSNAEAYWNGLNIWRPIIAGPHAVRWTDPDYDGNDITGTITYT